MSVVQERKVSSAILRSEYLTDHNQNDIESVKYIEVPVVEEVIRHVPRREVVEVEKRVPKYEYRYVDRTIEVPQIQYVDRVVEVPEIQEQIRYVNKTEIVDIPREIIEHIPKIEKRVIDKYVDVPGDFVHVPRPYTVERTFNTDQYHPTSHPVVVAQTFRPIITDSKHTISVPVKQYRPNVVEVIVPVAKIVDVPLVHHGVVAENNLYKADLNEYQYQHLFRHLNPHIVDVQVLPWYQSNSAPMTPFINQAAEPTVVNEIVSNRSPHHAGGYGSAMLAQSPSQAFSPYGATYPRTPTYQATQPFGFPAPMPAYPSRYVSTSSPHKSDIARSMVSFDQPYPNNAFMSPSSGKVGSSKMNEIPSVLDCNLPPVVPAHPQPRRMKPTPTVSRR